MADYLLGLDAGTTSVKAALFDNQGTCLGIAREEYLLITPSAEQAELEAETYWQSSIRAIGTAIQASGVPPAEVRAIAISSQGETTIPINAQGTPLRPALVWLDNRSHAQSQWLISQFDAQEVYELTGVPEITPTWSAPKILWIRQNEPDKFEQVYKYLLVKDYLTYRLSGEFATDGSVACTSMLYNIREHQWWREMLEAVGITAEQLPAITLPGEAVGKLTPLAAKTTGLSQQTLVINGGMDQAVGAIGAGSVTPEVISESTGAALAIQVTTPYPEMDTVNRIPLYVHSLPGLYLFVPVLPTGGMAFKWFRDTFGDHEAQAARESKRDAYDLLTEIAASVAPGSDGLVMLPHLMGAYSPVENPAARGVFSGFTLRHSKAHFVRAILEGVAFNLRQNLLVLNEAGYHFSEIRTSGGGARSRLWTQIKADVCGLPIATLANEETALLGDAILAGVACGVFSSVAEACAQMVTIKERIQPGAASAEYEKHYQRYIELNQCLDPYFRSNYSG